MNLVPPADGVGSQILTGQLIFGHPLAARQKYTSGDTAPCS